MLNQPDMLASKLASNRDSSSWPQFNFNNFNFGNFGNHATLSFVTLSFDFLIS
jgi:hypothetical protein